ncbi:MAG: hypothetical protein ACC645_13625, partial [Pirellulales bacterium]
MFRYRLSRRPPVRMPGSRLRAVLALLLVSSGGCQLTAPGSDSADALERVESVPTRSDGSTSSDGTKHASIAPLRGDRNGADNDSSEAAPRTDGASSENLTQTHQVSAVKKSLPPVLADEAWVRRIGGPSGEVSHEKVPRWRHAGLEDLMARPAERRPHFARWIDHANRVVAGNAAIAATRLGEARPVERLGGPVGSPQVTPAARVAA